MKFRQRGFTLVELLVVIAIIAILSAIVVPGVTGYIKQSRMTKAIAEINGIETQLVKIMSDAGRSSLQHLFDGEMFAWYVEGTTDWQRGVGMPLTVRALEKSRDMYTRTFYGLLRGGRSIVNEADPELGIQFGEILNEGIVKQLGTSYLDIGLDPWGQMYNIYAGPWPRQGQGTIPFRTYRIIDAKTSNLPGSRSNKRDVLTLTNVEDVETGDIEPIGFPAPYDAVAYIWSNGENIISGQAFEGVYIQNPAQAEEGYEPQDPMLKGGGDDINNWDNTQSYSLFY